MNLLRALAAAASQDATSVQRGRSTLPAPYGRVIPDLPKLMRREDLPARDFAGTIRPEEILRGEMPLNPGDLARKTIRVGGLWFSPQEVNAGKHIATRKRAGLPDLTAEQLKDIEAQLIGNKSLSSVWDRISAATSDVTTYTEKGKKVYRHGPKGEPMYARWETLDGEIHEFPTHADLDAWRKSNR